MLFCSTCEFLLF